MSNILDFTFGPLLKTGQTTDRTPAGRTTKDDGGFQRGINESKQDGQYTILTTGQYSGTTNITVNGKTDTHSNECVYDKATALMWSRTASASVFGTGAENLFWDDTAGAGEDIFAYCDAANNANLAGYSDWRIPNVYELYSLADLSFGSALPNSTAFPTWPSNIFWCSTTVPISVTGGLRVWFNQGIVSFSVKTTTRLFTALVRLGIES